MSDLPKKKKPRPPRKISKTYLQNAGLHYLNRYASSSENFRRVLQRKIQKSEHYHGSVPEECQDWVNEIIQRYQECGLLNDDVYALSRVGSLRRQGSSRKAIIAKLSQKGLSHDAITKALNAYEEEQQTDKDPEWLAAVKLARKRRLGPFQPDPIKRQDKQQNHMASLARAGFSFDIAKKIIESELEDFDIYT